MSKKRRQNIWLWSNMRPSFAQGRSSIFIIAFLETGDRAKNGKRLKKKWSNCRKHICLLSLQLNYLSREMNFPLRRQADTGPHVQGKSSISIFSLLKRGSQAQEIKALLSNYRELVVTQRKSTISSLFGKAT